MMEHLCSHAMPTGDPVEHELNETNAHAKTKENEGKSANVGQGSSVSGSIHERGIETGIEGRAELSDNGKTILDSLNDQSTHQ